MANMVFVCQEGNTGTFTALGMTTDHRAPTCLTGQGSWIAADTLFPENQPFDVSTLDPATLGDAFGAGFITFGTGLVLVLAVRVLLRMIRTN